MKNVRKKTLSFFAALFIALFSVLPITAQASSDNNTGESELAFLSEKGVRIGVATGTIQDMIVNSLYPDADIEYIEKFQGYLSVSQGKLDAYVYDKRQMLLAIANGQQGVRVLDETLAEPAKVALGISKNPAIPEFKNSLNYFIDKIKSDGTLDDMYERWSVQGNYEMPQIDAPSNPHYHIKVATTGDVAPYSFYQNNELTGYDIEIMKRFGAWFGADIEFFIYDWDSIVPALQAGKVDVISSNLNDTPEREEAIDFSDSLYEIEHGVMVQDTGTEAKPGIFESIADSFEKTFIREDRYKLFLSGILTTVIITVFSILFGTALGFIIYMCCRKGKKAPNIIAKIFFSLIHGMPVVVLLMILYYIVFAKAAVSGTIVAIIAFTLVFASAVFSMLKAGVGAVERGQEEAALSLGYGDLRSFFRIILPQALPHFLPTYKGEVVSLLKATAIVGYIGVQDLTKMGDIVRGRTYEAFFPLIAIAIIYFALGGLLIFLVSRIEIKLDPKKRKRKKLLKGVKTDA